MSNSDIELNLRGMFFCVVWSIYTHVVAKWMSSFLVAGNFFSTWPPTACLLLVDGSGHSSEATPITDSSCTVLVRAEISIASNNLGNHALFESPIKLGWLFDIDYWAMSQHLLVFGKQTVSSLCLFKYFDLLYFVHQFVIIFSQWLFVGQVWVSIW